MNTATNLIALHAIDSAVTQLGREQILSAPSGAATATLPGMTCNEATNAKPQPITGELTSLGHSRPLAREDQHISIHLPSVIHRDDIRRGRVDLLAVRRREEADRKRLIEASRKPPQTSVTCDHTRPIKTYAFRDGKLLELYGCGCSNGREMMNGPGDTGRGGRKAMSKN